MDSEGSTGGLARKSVPRLGREPPSALSYIAAGDILILSALAIAVLGQAGIQQCALPSSAGFVNPGTTVCPGSLLLLFVAVVVLLAGALFVSFGLASRMGAQRAGGDGSGRAPTQFRTLALVRFVLVAGGGVVIMGLALQFIAPYFSCFRIQGGVCGAGIPSSWLPVPLALVVTGVVVLIGGAVSWLIHARSRDRAGRQTIVS